MCCSCSAKSHLNDVRRWLKLATGDASEAAASLQIDELNKRISSTLMVFTFYTWFTMT